MTDFSEISKKYERDSIVQKSASEILLGLADIKGDEYVLDLGCGTGHLSRMIKDRTAAAVIGVDPAPGMIEAARSTYGGADLSFRLLSADRLDYVDEFDVIFCNSVFQWFKEPEPVLAACYRALKPSGRMVIQAPAKQAYSPNFIEAVNRVAEDPVTGDTFGGFRSPWFFLETPQEYRALFEAAGFAVPRACIDSVETQHSPEEVFAIFESGAAAGYLNQEHNELTLTPEYARSFRDIVADTFRRQADASGRVRLSFHRIYLAGVKADRRE